MKQYNALITGGCGFIGLYIAEKLLEKGVNVFFLDRSPKKPPFKVSKIFKGDIMDRKAVAKAMKGMDIVYHLAGILGTEELLFQSSEAVKINVIGSINIMEEAIRNQTKLILVSKPNPWLNTYSITKETSEKFCMMYRKEFGLKAMIVKWFSVYGPGQKYKHVQKAVPTFIIRALKNEPIPVFGDGNQTADFIYTQDLALATVLIAESAKAEGKIVEIGTGKETKIIDLARMIIKYSNSKSRIEHLAMRKGEDIGARVVADTRMLYKLTRFKAKIDLKTGLKNTIDYYRQLISS